MQTILVAIKDGQKRRQVVSALRSVREQCHIRQADALEDVVGLVQAIGPDILVTTLDQQRQETMYLIDDLQVSVPQMSALLIAEVDDFELISRSVRAGAADYVLYPIDPTQLERVLSSIEEREEALFEASAPSSALLHQEKTAGQKRGEQSLLSLLEGGQPNTQDLLCEKTNKDAHLILLNGTDEASFLMFASYFEKASALYTALLPGRDRGAILVYPPQTQGMRWVRAQLMSAQAHIRFSGDRILHVGVAAPVEDVGTGLPTALMQARTAISFQFYHDEGSLTLYEDITKDLSRDVQVSMLSQNALVSALNGQDDAAKRVALDDVFAQLSWPRVRPALCLRTLNRLVMHLDADEAVIDQLTKSFETSKSLSDIHRAFAKIMIKS